MDVFIILLGILQFIIFLCSQLFFSRFTDSLKIMKWISVFFLICLVVVNMLYLLIGLYFHQFSLLVIFLSDLIYVILSQVYILGFFGITESSIRIRILSEIASCGSKGISYKDLLKIYNKEIIINKRLKRFVNSGELIYNRNYYQLGNIKTFSFIPAIIFSFYWRLYRGK